MHVLKHLRVAIGVGALLVLTVLPCRGYQQESTDAFLYNAAFQSYQKEEYDAAAQKLRLLLQRFPDSPLRDVAIFWLARSSFHAGDHGAAGRYMSIFCRDYPDNPLWETAEKELLLLARSQREASPLIPETAPHHVAEQTGREPVSETSAAEALHQTELLRAEQQAQAKLQANPEQRRTAAERKIQQVREALRKSEGTRQFREKQGG